MTHGNVIARSPAGAARLREPASADAAGQAGSIPVCAVASLRDVRFRYPRATQDALLVERFDVEDGERVFVRGPSGSGKTTLLSLLAGVLVPSEGTASIRGSSWGALSVARRDRVRVDSIGYIFQQFNLLGYLSVLDNVLLPCRFSASRRARAGGSSEAMIASARRLLDGMKLDASVSSLQASALSVGQQQRVAAARALIGQPGLVIADEPTSALDEDARESFMDMLLTACAEASSSLVFVSHDARLADRFDRQVDLATLNRAGPEAEITR